MDSTHFTQILGYFPDLMNGAWVTLQARPPQHRPGPGAGAVSRPGQVLAIQAGGLAGDRLYRVLPDDAAAGPDRLALLRFARPDRLRSRRVRRRAVALGLNVAAFYAEIFRAGLIAVNRTQWQAARVLGLGPVDTLRFVILPQAVRNVLPPMGTTTIYLVKDTALASAIGAAELLRVGQLIAVETFRPVETLTLVAVIYFVITYPMALMIVALERRFKAARA